jgi:hypothetical protein
VSGRHRWCTAAWVLALLAAACSPALNWRQVPLEGLVTLLPCKPDRAERQVQLGAADALLRMAGCEASGALYAISHVRVADASQMESAHQAWRQATLAAMQATAVPASAAAPYANPVAAQAKGTLNPEKRDGKRPDGSAVQAQLLWLRNGPDLYHVAVYGTKLDKDMTELLFSELRLQ